MSGVAARLRAAWPRLALLVAFLALAVLLLGSTWTAPTTEGPYTVNVSVTDLSPQMGCPLYCITGCCKISI